MKIKSALATQISGSIGGMTGSHNQSGLYLRARSIPVNPQTEYQVAVRNGLANGAAAWGQTLTATQRQGWTNYALHTPLVNTLGDPIIVSGINMYIRSYTVAVQAGITAPTDPPPLYGLPAFTGVSLTGNIGNLDVGFSTDDLWANSDTGYMLVYMSRPQKPTIQFFKGPYRYAGKIEGNATTPPTSPATITSPFAPTAAGQIQYVQIRVYLDSALSGVWRGSFVVDF